MTHLRGGACSSGVEVELAALCGRGTMVEAELVTARATRDQLAAEVERLRLDNQRLRTRVDELTAQVEQLRRASKRQAAPFSKGMAVSHPRRPGRKPGTAYDRHARRPVPDPDQVSRVVKVGLPESCPHCGGALSVERMACQYQQDLPPLPATEICRYDIQIGRCQQCRRRVQPRHPGQTSQALGAAAVAALVGGVQASPVVAPDETGWRVGGQRAWLWAFAGDGMTVYRIAAGRGFDDATAVLGADYPGVLERDGWAPYRKFTHATHQSCLAHLLRRCDELLSDAQRGRAKTPHAVRRILQQALAVRDARDASRLEAADAVAWAERLDAAVDKLIAGRTAYPPNRRLLAHLARERPALFTFLRTPGVQATNWRAEHAIRPAVVSRKTWGGNRTWAGAQSWQILASVLRTATQQHHDPIALLARLLRAPDPAVANLAIPTPVRGP
jgi:transposase